MSTSHKTHPREDDRLVSVLSHWLARHVGDDELRRELAEANQAQLSPDQVAAVEELLADLMSDQGRGELERSVRETLEALALG